MEALLGFLISYLPDLGICLLLQKFFFQFLLRLMNFIF